MINQEIFVKLEKINKNALVFSTKLRNINPCTEYCFYKGNVAYHEFYYEGDYDIDDKMIHIFNYIETEICFTYSVSFDSASHENVHKKLTTEWMRFCGEDVFILPDFIFVDPCLVTYRLTIDLSVGLFNGMAQVKTIESPCFGEINNLMKTCYLFSNLKTRTISLEQSKLDFMFEHTFLVKEQDHIIEEVSKLYLYYYTLFQNPIPKLSLCFYQGTKELDAMFSKTSSSMISLTFNPDVLTDWQRVSRCLFYAFFDYHFPYYKLHHSPYRWLKEGLATYYEVMALSTLGKIYNDTFYFDHMLSLQTVYTRYLYFKFKDEARLKMSPMQEPYIKSAGRLAFLHHTQSPLLILFLDQIVGVENAVFEWLIRYASDDFDIKIMMDDLLGINSTIFSNHYLFGLETIDLFDYFNQDKLSFSDLLRIINEFEYTLYTWFSQEDEHYINHHVEYPKVEQLTALAKAYQIHFSDSWMEEKIQNYQEGLYQLLMIHHLHLWVCGVDRLDLSLRHFIVNNPYQVVRWREFLTTVK